MKKRWLIFAFIAALSLLCLLGGCGKEEGTEDAFSASSNEQIEKDDQNLELANGENLTTAIPDETKMTNDLLEREINIFVLNGSEEYLDISSLEILRRKTDTDYDEAYVAVKFENEYYCVDTECVLYYSFYDVGGWYLDDYQISSYQSSAKKNPVTDADFIAYMCNQFSTCEIIYRTESVDEDGNFCEMFSFTATLDYNYLTVNFEGWLSMQFCNDYWYEECSFAETKIDWSKLIGTWSYRDESLNMGAGFYSVELSVDVTDIVQLNSKELNVTYSGKSYLYDRTSSILEVNQAIETQTQTMYITYQTENIMGQAVEIPSRFSGAHLPWEYGSNVFVRFDRDKGAYTENLAYNGSTDRFAKEVPVEDVQDALNKLKDMNQ